MSVRLLHFFRSGEFAQAVLEERNPIARCGKSFPVPTREGKPINGFGRHLCTGCLASCRPEVAIARIHFWAHRSGVPLEEEVQAA